MDRTALKAELEAVEFLAIIEKMKNFCDYVLDKDGMNYPYDIASHSQFLRHRMQELDRLCDELPLDNAPYKK